MNEKVRKLVTMAMLAALSIVLVYVIHFPIFPAASFLEYDPADIPILIGTFAYGPLAGVLLTVVVSVIQGMTVSSGSGLMGIAMHIFATSILVLVAGNIYRVKHTKKGAVLALSKALAQELGPSGIRVNAICPGVIQTDMCANVAPEVMESLREQTPIEKLGRPEDVAQAMAYLIDAPFVTGQVLGVNGGFVIT
jgi:NAD(P)-dependent dehydrogenase (short-subunit alcohol dehydrogenase family)